MPIQLTTPIQTGDLDINGPYQQVKIIEVLTYVTQQVIVVTCQYGNTITNNWVPGVLTGAAATQQYQVLFADVIAEEPEEGETAYEATSRILYEWLLDNNKFIGTFV